MAQVTVEQLAETVGASVDRLLSQMKDAGLPHASADEAVSEEDKQTVSRARKIQRFLSKPFFVAEVFTGAPGKYVPLKETIRAFKGILDGEYDHLPEGAFYMVGGIDEVKAKAEKMAAEAA